MRLLTIVFLWLLALPVLADEQMLYVEYHVIQFDKSQARASDLQTRKLWRVGSTYLRFEDVPDPESGVHGLIVVAEPDIWIADRKSKQIQHSVDPGPDYAIRFPILAREPAARLRALEFGGELQFFLANEARQLPARNVDGVQCKVYLLQVDDREVELLVRGDGKPFQVGVKSGDAGYAVRYTRYEPGGKPDMALFRAPTEATLD